MTFYRVSGAACRSAVISLCVWQLCSRAEVIPPVVRGGAIVMLAPEPGPLTITLLKRDLNIYDGQDTATVHIVDSVRGDVGRIELGDDGLEHRGAGPAKELQRAQATVDVDAPGVLKLLVACGSDLVWGLEFNCARYAIEIKKNVLLNDGSVSGRVYFAPPSREFSIKAQALHNPGIQTMCLFDSAGALLREFDLSKAGQDVEWVAAPEAGASDGLWYLDIEHMDVKFTVSGVSLWAFSEDAYFASTSRGLTILPRTAVRYVSPGERVRIPFSIYAAEGSSKQCGLVLQQEGSASRLHCAVEARGQDPAPYTKPSEIVTISAEAGHDSRPGDVLSALLVARSDADRWLAAGARIELRVGPAPVADVLELPIVTRRHQHENYQFGYAPDYVANEVYFAPDNRPYIRDRTANKHHTSAATFLQADGTWARSSFAEALRAAYPDYLRASSGAGFLGCKVAFDGSGGVYTLLRLSLSSKRRVAVLLYSPDRGSSWSVHEMADGSFDIENFSGHNTLAGPPPILNYVFRESHPARFCSYHRLRLLLPRKDGERLVLGDPIVITEDCLGSCQHSGGPPSLATRDGRTHIVWGEVTGDDAPGVPTCIATYDHAAGALGKKVLLAYGPPVNDVHNVPAVCFDSAGYIHVVTGAHGANFKYLRSRQPNDAYGGFTEPVNVLEAGCIGKDTDADGDGRQTYISLVCDGEDTLHIAYRQWRCGVDPYHGGSLYAALSIQSKPKGQRWGPARPVVVPPVSGYSIYYHKLTVDRRGGLYLSYSYFTADESYQSQFPELYNHCAVVVSKDHGVSWKLAETLDFLAGMRRSGLHQPGL